MAVRIGEVPTFANPEASKAQVVKMSEEVMEVFSAWEKMRECNLGNPDECHDWACYESCKHKQRMVDECADVITATCNLLAALGVDDMTDAMRACRKRNATRGRL